MLGILLVWLPLKFVVFTAEPPARRSLLTLGLAWLLWVAFRLALAAFMPNMRDGFFLTTAIGLVGALLFAAAWWVSLRRSWREEPDEIGAI